MLQYNWIWISSTTEHTYILVTAIYDSLHTYSELIHIISPKEYQIHLLHSINSLSDFTTCPYFSRAENCCFWSVASTMPSMAWYVSPCITTVKSDVVGSAPTLPTISDYNSNTFYQPLQCNWCVYMCMLTFKQNHHWPFVWQLTLNLSMSHLKVKVRGQNSWSMFLGGKKIQRRKTQPTMHAHLLCMLIEVTEILSKYTIKTVTV